MKQLSGYNSIDRNAVYSVYKDQKTCIDVIERQNLLQWLSSLLFAVLQTVSYSKESRGIDLNIPNGGFDTKMTLLIKQYIPQNALLLNSFRSADRAKLHDDVDLFGNARITSDRSEISAVACKHSKPITLAPNYQT